MLSTRRVQAATVADGVPAVPQDRDSKLLLTPKEALEWETSLKAKGGPTYAGSTGWKRYTDFLISKMQEFGAVDLDYVEIPYDHYIVEDWPDPHTHHADSAAAVEKLVTDGAPVPVIASYGMTSGFTPLEGITTAPLLYYDRVQPPTTEAMAGKILVFETAPYPAPPYTDQRSSTATLSPITSGVRRANGAPLFTPLPSSVTTSYHTRWGLQPAQRIRGHRHPRQGRGHRRCLRSPRLPPHSDSRSAASTLPTAVPASARSMSIARPSPSIA